MVSTQQGANQSKRNLHIKIDEIMRAIFIDVIKKEVSEVTIQPELASYYQTLNCRSIDFYRIDAKNDLMVDDEGLLKQSSQAYFQWGEIGFFAGSALVVGFDAETGKTLSTRMSLEKVKKMVTFVESDEIDLSDSFDMVFIEG